ncbi:small acid-soluble spore protein H [Cohnella cholangitidis]|uniref:Small acid-soluble spore protein H n=1 Tax=Cohnella cholangitidis TaxID=2598458 RepID=A0A7G5BSJ9_9BACL|nr:small acid-soluble spore protein H [Cohnella cholangitidis]QMV39933.1 small acid-soluble spore protein H [Cohnella cholangitidis]
MNKQRAAEIASSPVMANVTFGDNPVYIQHVDEENDTARIYPLAHPEQEQEVPIDMLMEHEPAQFEANTPIACPNK